MKHSADPAAGVMPAPHLRRWIILAAGMLALCLQLTAQMLPPAAMQNVMRVAALSADEAQSFAATCLNFDQPQTEPQAQTGSGKGGQPAKQNNHLNCPVCLTLAHNQGVATAPLALVTISAWAAINAAAVAIRLPAQSLAAASFASRAPPTYLG